MDRRKVVVVVDGMSTGTFFAPRLKKRGYEVFHVLSSAAYPREFKNMVQLQEYVGSLEYDGDMEKTLEKLAAYEVLAVIAGSEFGVSLTDTLSERLGLRGNGTALSPARRDKALALEAVRAHGLPAPESCCSANLEEIMAWVDRFDYWPVVLKPPASSGTDSVFFCENRDEVAQRFREIDHQVNQLGLTNVAVLAESYLKGVEYPVNTVSLDGRHYLTDLWRYDKVRRSGHSLIYNTTKLLPADGEEAAMLVPYTFGVLDALGIKNGPAHTEIMLTEDGPRLVECNARVMGAAVPPDLISAAIGRNQVDLTLDCFLDQEAFRRAVREPYRMRKHMILKTFIAEEPGRIVSMPGLKRIQNLKSYFSSELHVRAGDHLRRTVDLFTSPGRVLLTHEDERIVDADAATVRALELDGLFHVVPATETAAAPPPVRSLRITLPADLTYVEAFTMTARQFSAMNGADGVKAAKIEEAIEEAVSLLVRYTEWKKETFLEVLLERDERGIALRVFPRHAEWEIPDLPQFDAARAVETGDASGLELALLKGLMDEVELRDYGPKMREIYLLLKL